MRSLYVPVHQGVTGSTDWRLIVGLVVLMAIALTAVLVYARGSAKPLPLPTSKPAASDRKVA